jgi:hypothetical protein
MATVCSVAVFGDASVHADGKAARGRIVLSAEQARQCHGTLGTYVTPSKSDLQRLEALLPGAVRHSVSDPTVAVALRGKARRVADRMATDVLFYSATSDGFIEVQGFCADIVPDMARRKCPPVIVEGGSCVWRIRYQVKTETFDRFGANSDG